MMRTLASAEVITHSGPLCLVLLLAFVGAPALAAGQPSWSGGGFTVGATPNLAKGFSTDQICQTQSAASLSARATFALTRILQLELLGEAFNGRGNNCVDGLVPPVPPTGPYTYTVDYYEENITGPPTVLSLRVGASLPNAGNLVVRPYVGIARVAGKDITIPQAGFTILVGGSPLRLLLEAEGWWYDVPRQHREEEYFNGQLIRRSLTEQAIHSFTTVYRLGFTTAVGRSWIKGSEYLKTE